MKIVGFSVWSHLFLELKKIQYNKTKYNKTKYKIRNTIYNIPIYNTFILSAKIDADIDARKLAPLALHDYNYNCWGQPSTEKSPAWRSEEFLFIFLSLIDV